MASRRASNHLGHAVTERVSRAHHRQTAARFARAAEPDRAFGANIAGAMLGGLAEYTSMRLGFQYVGYVAIGFYLLAMLSLKMQKEGEFNRKEEDALPIDDSAGPHEAHESHGRV
jgi:predicted lipid-binding transport protein (Tim44 family)